MKQNRKWKIPYTVLERRTFCFSSYKIWKLKKSKTVMRWSSLKKKEGFFCSVYFVQKNFLTFVFYLNVKGIDYILRIYTISWDQEIDSRFMNHEPLISTL